MKIHESGSNNFIISTDKNKLQVEVIYNYLSNKSYWAKNISLDIVKRSINGSFCFGVYETRGEKNISLIQIGFARVVTDHATFAYLADVFIDEKFRGLGLAKGLMTEIMNHKDLQGLRRWMLATKDAHGLYAGFGFSALDKPERIMAFKPFDEYPKNIS